ncbi:MAG: ABC transporter ATP-binding protein [Cyclobacteriaceae bacterium]|jgi:iron complex transport system ATP-binding protein|nr:ABC transporter ATP-binding protein [Cyclobacteriaceae bacterium]
MVFVQNLSVGYQKGKEKNLLLDHIDVSLPSGKLVCLLGSNGSGKSTFLKTLAGIHPPLSQPADQTLIEFQKPGNIAIVLTDKLNLSNLSVYDLVTTGRYAYVNWLIQLSETDKHAINQAFHLVGIDQLKDKFVDELSDGQQQMVMIARALAQETPYIFLDEPTAHLDLNNRMEIMTLLRKLAHQHNKTILVSTHELDLALQLADVLWLVQDKKIVSGIPEELVLDGVLDKAFPLKGFNLKTGEMNYEKTKNKSIQLIGEGYRYLWTKNAFERMGFSVINEKAEIQIEVEKEYWKIDSNRYNRLQLLLEDLINREIK